LGDDIVSDRTAEEIWDGYVETGDMPTPAELEALCHSAMSAETAQLALEALSEALSDAGWTVNDVTTDDTNGPAVMLIPPQPEE
jgi:hypothetical protein